MKLIENRFNQAKFLVANAAERGLTPEQAYGHVILDALRRFVNRTFNKDDLYSALMGAANTIHGDTLKDSGEFIVRCLVVDLNEGDTSIAEAEIQLKSEFQKKAEDALHRDSTVPGAGGDRGPDGGPGTDPREG